MGGGLLGLIAFGAQDLYLSYFNQKHNEEYVMKIVGIQRRWRKKRLERICKSLLFLPKDIVYFIIKEYLEEEYDICYGDY